MDQSGAGAGQVAKIAPPVQVAILRQPPVQVPFNHVNHDRRLCNVKTATCPGGHYHKMAKLDA